MTTTAPDMDIIITRVDYIFTITQEELNWIIVKTVSKGPADYDLASSTASGDMDRSLPHKRIPALTSPLGRACKLVARGARHQRSPRNYPTINVGIGSNVNFHFIDGTARCRSHMDDGATSTELRNCALIIVRTTIYCPPLWRIPALTSPLRRA